LKKRSSTWFSTKMACGFRAGENYIVGSTIYIGRQLVYNNKRIHTSPGRLFLFSHDGWGEINVCPGRLSSPVRTVSRYFLNVAGQREREMLKSPWEESNLFPSPSPCRPNKYIRKVKAKRI
jgi:hypothetical protein